ncbi:MAG: hypothetical protein J6X86_02290 [Bacteroidales bacterium]|nr:hypothetical protein [Bacteroidales bacterium]
MYKKGLKRWCICCLLAIVAFSASAYAQNGINSPYSQYGIGLNNMPYNMPAFASLGGVAYSRSASNMVNPFNPASYASIGMESFVFDMGLNIETSKLYNNNESQFDADGNLGYLAFGFPLTKWWKTAIAVMPMSDVDYQSTYTTVQPPAGEVKTLYDGTGAVTQFMWGHAFNILGNNNATKTQMRAGFNVNYLYGNISRAISNEFSGNDTTYFMNSRRQKETYLKNVTFDLGLQFDQPLGENHRLSAGFVIKPPRKMTVKDNALVYTFVTNAATEYMRDTIFPADGNDSEYESTLEQPFTTGIGLSFQRNDRWLIALDATFSPWNGLKYTENSSVAIFGQSPMRYDNTYKLAIGMQLLGDKNAAKYFRRITFSAGAHYENGRLNLQLVDNSQYRLDEWGCGIGMSLPMRKGRSVLNLSLSYSSFGTADLLRRDALQFGIAIGSCESWFVKRKFN